MNSEKDWKEELDSFGERLKARKAAEKYAPWHPRNVILHPTRTWRLAFGIVGDNEMERALAHMDSGTAGSKDKPRPKPKHKWDVIVARYMYWFYGTFVMRSWGEWSMELRGPLLQIIRKIFKKTTCFTKPSHVLGRGLSGERWWKKCDPFNSVLCQSLWTCGIK
jgi:hypothetical protein